jgi:hypothetical protein
MDCVDGVAGSAAAVVLLLLPSEQLALPYPTKSSTAPAVGVGQMTVCNPEVLLTSASLPPVALMLIVDVAYEVLPDVNGGLGRATPLAPPDANCK